MHRPPRVFAIFVCLFLVAALTVACGGGGDEPEPTPEATPAPSPTTVPTPSAGDLAQSVVQILALDFAGDAVWWGSGTVISSDGLILTNAHVVDDRAGEYDMLGVAVTSRTDQPPEPAYLAEIEAVDYVLDLAVVRVVGDGDGVPVDVDLPFIPLGDSDEVDIGDGIRILGFPGIGGETITFTEGSISGFTAQRDVGDRAWIKTDATISGGNSGGLAANEDGEIIGIPTIVGSSEALDEPVDCRFVVDTNRDGVIDAGDNCVPVGGFINGLRPVALAVPLIDAAETDTAYVSAFPEPELPGMFDPAPVTFSSLMFADGVTAADEPAQVLPFLYSGVTDVCAFWDYEAMADGAAWEALWFVDGELDEYGSIIDETWFGGESGNWWVCILDEMGLPDGLYELVLSVEGEFQTSDAVFVGGDHPLVEVDLQNLSQDLVCYAFLSPTEAENWGQDELGAEEIIEPGYETTLFVPAGFYDVLLADCDGETLKEEYALDMTLGATLTLP
jgi:hypothetical protein